MKIIRGNRTHAGADAGAAHDGRAGKALAALPAATTACLVGLTWGLVFGLVDALPALADGDPLQNLGRRLLALLFMALWNALAFGLVLTAGGLLLDAAFGLARRRASRSAAASVAWGLCTGLSVAAYGLQRYPAGSPLLISALALLAGAAVARLAWLVAAQPSRRRRSGRWVLITTSVGLLVLLAIGVGRVTVRDVKKYNPRVTAQSATPERPNIVLITIDALRADRLGVYGYEPSPSPRIDELASRGLVFRQAISQGNSTYQAVGSFMTSLYPTELGLFDNLQWMIDPERVTLAEALQAGGYRTQAFVANGRLGFAGGFAQGFDGYVAPEPGRPYDLDRLRDETIVAGLGCRLSPVLCQVFTWAYERLFDPPLVMENEGRRINARALRFVRLHRDEQFFLWLHYMETHSPYNPSQMFGVASTPKQRQIEQKLRDWVPSNRTVPIVVGPTEQTLLRGLYDGEVQDVDRLVGQIWDEIAAQGLADRTLLVITADHGDEFGDHGYYEHGQDLYQDLVHVPLIFVGPQVVAPGRTVDTPVPMLDLLPTLVDIAGAPQPDLVHGESLLPVLAGAPSPEREFYSQNRANRVFYEQDALLQGYFKLIYTPGRDIAQLYDLRSDPDELRDLASAEPERVAAMRAKLRAWEVSITKAWAGLPKSGVAQEEIDPAMQQALKRIGY